MKIGIIGAGSIGATLAKLFARAGHHIAISNSRGPETLADLVGQLGSNVRATTVEDAAAFGEVVVEAIPFGRYKTLPVEPLAGKIVISAANYYPDRDGDIDLAGLAQTQLVANHLPQTRVVKAFNTIWFKHLADQGDISKPIEERRVIFLAGDDSEAKKLVSSLIEEIGFGAVDTGNLAGSQIQEPGAKIYNADITVRQAREALA
ncbi:MAG: NAD(P)-binding domain-containing protein [Proteobacteria bacterium]|nr:NAD(P)-binding domain-containing protein [Pseudomonadota bacterium]